MLTPYQQVKPIFILLFTHIIVCCLAFTKEIVVMGPHIFCFDFTGNKNDGKCFYIVFAFSDAIAKNFETSWKFKVFS